MNLFNNWKQFFLGLVFSSFFLPLLSFSQSQEDLGNKIVKVKLMYLSKESIRNTFLDEDGIEHTVFNSKQDALIHIKQVYKEISNLNDFKNKPNPFVFFIWKYNNEFQDEKNEEFIFFDLEKNKESDFQLSK